MKKICILLSLFVTSVSADTGAYDPLADIVSTTKKEISVKGTVQEAKDELVSPKALKLKKGYWQFFQGVKDPKPGEACTAVYMQDDKLITIIGPGKEYKGALLGFIAIEPPNDTFPRPDDEKGIQKVSVTLKQGSDNPVTIQAFNRTVVPLTDELTFAVPTIKDALDNMEDKLRFQIDYEGKRAFDLEWHSGHAARDVLKRCLKGEDVSKQEVL
jgi:hypothetical protein